jgi:hypothetical protein
LSVDNKETNNFYLNKHSRDKDSIIDAIGTIISKHLGLFQQHREFVDPFEAGKIDYLNRMKPIKRVGFRNPENIF